ncbi:MAG: hypothetical protein HYS17_00910 [Micavibrio aeruginosavorus]|uniref:Uncharacterized protein n=1 Tax=Micavibrio aeruginosavorus TaxID=349221 RepID=A0A7T5R2T0_9BACT|nr:MAG: hypothetical protein HYS17_00910 [Micavibrio aeruginosavorus]
MKFTIVDLFNRHALCFEGPHYAVVMDVPETLGGGRRVVDLIPADGHLDAARIRKGFREAAKFMPFRRTAGGGGEIDFLSKDFQGNVYKQSRAHIPARPLAGKGFVDSYFDWLCWRARTHLWLQGTKPADIPEALASHILEKVLSQIKLPPLPSEGLKPCESPARSGEAVKPDYKPARARRAPLTQEAAPL